MRVASRRRCRPAGSSRAPRWPGPGAGPRRRARQPATPDAGADLDRRRRAVASRRCGGGARGRRHAGSDPDPAPGCRRDGGALMASLATYLSFVRFSHTVFALPFALTGALLAARGHGRSTGRHAAGSCWRWCRRAAPPWASTGWSTPRFDAAQPAHRRPRAAARRDDARARPRRSSSCASVVFVAAAFQISALCGWLSPVALAIVFWYSLAKRYTHYTQAFLGLAMAVAPVGGWLAAGGRGGWEPWLLGLAIGLWVGRLRHHLRLPGRRGRSRAGAASRFRCGSASPGRLRSRGRCTSATVAGAWRAWRWSRRSGRSISPAWRSWRRCSPTSSRW